MRRKYRDNELVTLLRELGYVTLKELAASANACPKRIYTAAKIENRAAADSWEERYDWAKVEAYIRLHLDVDKGHPTIRSVVEHAIRNKKRQKLDFEIIDGKRVQPRWYLNCDINYTEHGWHTKPIPVVLLRASNEVFTIVYQTRAYTLLQGVDINGNFTSNKTKNLSNETLNRRAVPFRAMSRDEVMRRYPEAWRGEGL